jgi:hypothetical protein
MIARRDSQYLAARLSILLVLIGIGGLLSSDDDECHGQGYTHARLRNIDTARCRRLQLLEPLQNQMLQPASETDYHNLLGFFDHMSHGSVRAASIAVGSHESQATSRVTSARRSSSGMPPQSRIDLPRLTDVFWQCSKTTSTAALVWTMPAR